MTGIDRRDGTPMGPPWPVEVVADLHAGVFDDAVSAALRPRMAADAGASAVLAALDATAHDLRAVATLPAPPMPAGFAARLDEALAAESRARSSASTPVQPAPVLDLARARRKRRIGWAGGLLVAAAAVAGIVFVALPSGTGARSPGQALPGGASAPQAFTRTQLGNGVALASALGRTDYGSFADPQRRAACLQANGQDADRTPAGAMPVTLDGHAGQLFVLTTGTLARYRLLVVGSNCAAGTPDTLANAVIGGLPAPVPTTR